MIDKQEIPMGWTDLRDFVASMMMEQSLEAPPRNPVTLEVVSHVLQSGEGAKTFGAKAFRNAVRQLARVSLGQQDSVLSEGQRPWPVEEATPQVPEPRRPRRYRGPYYRRAHGNGRIGYSI